MKRGETKMKNWIIKHKILTAIIILFLIGIINGSSNNKSVQKSDSSSTVLLTQKPSVSAIISPTEYVPKSQTEQEFLNIVKESSKPKLKVSINYTSTYLSITNDEDVQLNECIAWIPKYSKDNAYANDDWITIEPHQTKSIAWATMTLLDGTRFNYFETKPSSVEVTCTLSTTKEERSQIFSL